MLVTVENNSRKFQKNKSLVVTGIQKSILIKKTLRLREILTQRLKLVLTTNYAETLYPIF